MHSVDVEKMVLRLWDSGKYNRQQISTWFSQHYKGGYHLPHATVSHIIKTRDKRELKHADTVEMTAIALDKAPPPPKIMHPRIEQAALEAPSGGFSVDEQIGGYVEKEHSSPLKSKPVGETVLVIPDLHCPFEHPDALAFLMLVRDTYRPSVVVSLGDEIDAAAFSRYPKDPDGLAAGKELSEAKEHLHAFYLNFPKVLVCESNHTVRPWKLAFEAGLPSNFLRAIETVLNAPDGWRWENKHVIDNVVYMHGDAGSSGFTAHIQYMRKLKKSVVIGHIHSFAGVNYEGHLFGMNTGCLIDKSAYCFKYAKNMPIEVNLGCGIVKNGKAAKFIPMHVDEHNRWTGEL